MQHKFSLAALALACIAGTAIADDAATTIPAPVVFSELAAKCAPKVNHQTLNALVGNESTYNPYAIGVVDGVLERQPRTRAEANATAEQLEREGYNFSVGIGQFNIKNIRAMGLTVDELFDACRNLEVSSELFVGYYTDALATTPNKQEAVRKALSRYYSGNERRGFVPDKPGDPSYVQKVVSRALDPNKVDPIVPAIEPIEGEAVAPVAVSSTRGANAPVRPRRAAQVANEQWVIVTPDRAAKQLTEAPESASTDSDTEDAKPDDKSRPSVQVALNTGDEEGAEPVAEFHRPKPAARKSERQANPQQSAPSFVQIIN
jgi:type IV secretion system protein VirB1